MLLFNMWKSYLQLILFPIYNKLDCSSSQRGLINALETLQITSERSMNKLYNQVEDTSALKTELLVYRNTFKV